MILLIDCAAPGNALFGTCPVPWTAWLFMLPFAVAMLLAEKGRKSNVRLSKPDIVASWRVLNSPTAATLPQQQCHARHKRQ